MNSGLCSWLYKILLLGLAMAGVIIFFFHFLKGAAN
jgi:hypothetical protein